MTSRSASLRPALRDLLAGGLFLVLGLGFAIGATDYDLGSPARMGPGFFPFVLGGLLAVLGVAVMVKGVIAPDGEAIGPIPWRPLILVVGSILFFGVTVRGLGMAPTLFVSVFLSALASRETRLPGAAAIAAGLTLLCILIFVVALQLRLSLVGPWLGGV